MERVESPALQAVLGEVFQERQIDFSQYRENLLERRVKARMRRTRRPTFETYLSYLSGNREEMDALLDALTINTTQFFRDPAVFEAIRERVLPEIFPPRPPRHRGMVRILSCGCSGGEEATSVLILIAEYLGAQLGGAALEVIGTDIDRWAIEKAREGIYEGYEFQTMPRGFREQYFVDMGNGRFWRKEEWNRFLSFRELDIVREELPKPADLLLCRNLFIYFKPELQARCVEKFSRALRPGGFLVLGLTEFLKKPDSNDFAEFDRAHRIYRKR